MEKGSKNIVVLNDTIDDSKARVFKCDPLGFKFLLERIQAFNPFLNLVRTAIVGYNRAVSSVDNETDTLTKARSAKTTKLEAQLSALVSKPR